MKIVKERESLYKATMIVEKLLSNRVFSSEKDVDIEKWISWFQKQSSLFKDKKISVPQYFTQITRISSFLISNTSLTQADLFEVEREDRKKIYNLSKSETAAPKALREEEFLNLAKILFKQISNKTPNNLKKNTRIERLTSDMRNKRFGFTLDSDPQKNIDHTINNSLYETDANELPL